MSLPLLSDQLGDIKRRLVPKQKADRGSIGGTNGLVWVASPKRKEKIYSY